MCFDERVYRAQYVGGTMRMRVYRAQGVGGTMRLQHVHVSFGAFSLEWRRDSGHGITRRQNVSRFGKGVWVTMSGEYRIRKCVYVCGAVSHLLSVHIFIVPSCAQAALFAAL